MFAIPYLCSSGSARPDPRKFGPPDPNKFDRAPGVRNSGVSWGASSSLSRPSPGVPSGWSPCGDGPVAPVAMDFQATTPCDQEVLAAMAPSAVASIVFPEAPAGSRVDKLLMIDTPNLSYCQSRRGLI